MLETPDDLKEIGRYRVLRPLGQGAMAEVYLAELSTLGGFRRKVALKVVKTEFARDPKFGQLMAREAMIGSRLQHPNIVETLEFNEIDGRMFLALEFVEGQTVEELLIQTRNEGQEGLPLDLALEIIIQVLKGLSYAHRLTSPEGEVMGIIHRDLKPGNIMVSRHGIVKVMDFGIAKAKVACATITAAGQVRGTPIYMAPEQVTGKPLDGRCDQFAAATVLYELITGKQLFIARNLIEIMRRVSRADVGDALRLLSRLHPELERILGTMWAADSADRFPDCDEPARELEELLPEIKRAIANGEIGDPDQTFDDDDDGEPVVKQKAKPKARQQAKEKERPVGVLGRFFGLGKKAEKPKKKRRKKRSGDAGESGNRPRKRKKRASSSPSGQSGVPVADTIDMPATGGRLAPEPLAAAAARGKKSASSADSTSGEADPSMVFEDATFDEPRDENAKPGDEASSAAAEVASPDEAGTPGEPEAADEAAAPESPDAEGGADSSDEDPAEDSSDDEGSAPAEDSAAGDGADEELNGDDSSDGADGADELDESADVEASSEPPSDPAVGSEANFSSADEEQPDESEVQIEIEDEEEEESETGDESSPAETRPDQLAVSGPSSESKLDRSNRPSAGLRIEAQDATQDEDSEEDGEALDAFFFED